MPTVVFPPPPILLTAELALAARQRGWPVETYTSPPPPDRFGGRDEVVLYGDWRVVTDLARKWGQALLAPTAGWLPGLPEAYRRRDMRLLSWREALALREPAFLKPVLTKGLAQVYASGADLPEPESRPPDEPVLASEPVTWDLEVRCFVRERRVAAASPYYRGGQPITDADCAPATDTEVDEAAAFAERLLNDPAVASPPAFVVDVGKIVGRGWAVVEAGPAWFCAKYFADSWGVLDVLQRACVPRLYVAPEDEPWVVNGVELAAGA